MNYAQIAGPGDVWFDPSYDEAQGWTKHKPCDGEGCSECKFCGGEHEGKLMSLQAYQSMLRFEREESKA